MHLKERLHAKGWNHAEIEHALYHMNLAEQRKHPFVKFTETSTYWIILFAIAFSALTFSTYLFPFFNMLPKSISYVTVGIVGLIAGALFSHVLHDIDTLVHKHHLFALVFTLVVTLILSWSYLELATIFASLFSLQYLYHWWTK